jgi:hypothetical protein
MDLRRRRRRQIIAPPDFFVIPFVSASVPQMKPRQKIKY